MGLQAGPLGKRYTLGNFKPLLLSQIRAAGNIEGKRRLQHTAISDRDELLHSTGVRLVQKVDRIWPSLNCIPFPVLIAWDLVTQSFPNRYPFVRWNKVSSATKSGNVGNVFGAFHGKRLQFQRSSGLQKMIARPAVAFCIAIGLAPR